MKKLLLILLVALVVGCSSVKPIKVDEDLWRYTQEFIELAEEAGVKTDVLNDSLSSIVIYPLENNTYGLYSPPNRQVVINSMILFDSIVTKKVVFHELGHVLGLKHDKVGIMKTYEYGDVIHRRYCPECNPGNNNWEDHLEYFFFRIKAIQERK